MPATSSLRRIVEAAKDVSGAKYAALGVIGTDGLLEQFVHSGMDEATVEATSNASPFWRIGTGSPAICMTT